MERRMAPKARTDRFRRRVRQRWARWSRQVVAFRWNGRLKHRLRNVTRSCTWWLKCLVGYLLLVGPIFNIQCTVLRGID